MKYISTRDMNKSVYSFTDVLMRGLADDGGLFVPECYPKLSLSQLESLSKKSYSDLAYDIMSLFISDSIDSDILKTILKDTYNSNVFKYNEITPVKNVYNSIFIQDLSTGPSLAFKDLAMQFLGNIMDYVLNTTNSRLTILGASSGDTVSAAEEALRSKACIDVVMLTPKNGMSPFQKAQAGSILDENIFNLSIQGPFDRCQDIVKEVNCDMEFKSKYSIGAVNSINWGRICAQIVYYFNGYFLAVKKVGDVVDFVVPSGNFGNILAGYIAKEMGLPIRNLGVSTNENVVLDHFFKTGHYTQKDVVVTSSPSMDISKASNIERLFFDVLDRDPLKCVQLMNTFESTRSVSLDDKLAILTKTKGFESDSCTHQQRIECIKKVYKDTSYIIDPHTAAALKFAFNKVKSDDKTPVICMETAKPTKFESVIDEALGFIPERSAGFVDLELKDQRFFDVDNTTAAVKEFIASTIGVK
jgi:threonine synthase